MKRLIMLMMLAAIIIMTGCDSSYSSNKNATESDTIGVGILGTNKKSKADTIIIVTKDKKENVLLPDVEQVAEGKIPLSKIINGATHSRRIVLLVAVLVVFLLFIRLIGALIFKEQGRVPLRLVALITLVCGWALYFVGFFFGGTASSVMAYSVRPLIASLGMFVGNTGYQELSDDCTQSVLYMTLFAIVHLSAILVSAIFVVNFFWKRSKSYLRGKFWSFTRSSIPLNVFWGLGKQNILLAQSIQKQKKGKERILFIDLPTEEDGQNVGLNLSQLFGFNAYNQEAIRELQGVKYAIKGANGKPSDVETSSGDILVKIGLRPLKGLINHHQHTRIFFLSDNEVDNVKSTISFMHDNTLKKNNVDIYCHARKNRENSIIEKMAYLKGENGLMNVHIVDTSALSIQILKRNVEYQPVSFVDPDTSFAVVDNPFNAFVLGFGETGRDAVRYLYEFGAFVNSYGLKSPYKCYAVDKNMDQLKGDFYNNAPALRNNPEIELIQMSNLSTSFWPWVEHILPKLNYVVIALGDDRSNMQAASDLFEAACKVRIDNMKNFKIFVRSYSRESEKQMDNLVRFYNDKYGIKDKKENAISDVLVIFGRTSELFTYENIIDDETIKRAKEFFLGYLKKSHQDDEWDQRHRISIKKKNENGKEFKIDKPRDSVTLSDINAVIRKENQDIANSHHMDTKLKLVGLTRKSAKELMEQKDNSELTEEQLRQKELLEYILLYVNGLKKDYIKDSVEKNYNRNDGVLTKIAICEHLRWNASHEMIGYVLGDVADEIKKIHNCLRPWRLLPDNIQNYDYNVMEQTIKIVLNENTEGNESKC